MDPTTQRIQSTQNATGSGPLDGYNAPFSSLDISDILCILYPLSDSARDEVQRMATANSPFVIHRIAANNLGTNLALKDDAMNVESTIEFQGNYALVLRLSNTLKVPAVGFSFGRNASQCDIVLAQDPLRRLSNVHFRIYVNEVGSVKIQDESTNGTYVDNMLLNAKAQTTAERQRTLISGTKIRLCLHKATHDIEFQVQIPRRDESYEFIYLSRVGKYIKQAVARDTAVVGNTSMFDRTSKAVFAKPTLRNAATSEWTGSGKYNKGNLIGKGAFAMVYKVTSKYDGLPYAAKELEKRHFIKNGKLDHKIENEMKISQRVNHPYIIRYMESIDWNNQSLIIIMEYIPGGDLGMLIADNKPFSEDNAKLCSVQLLSALSYLHANNFTHGHVKPENILINRLDPLEVKLTNLCLSKVVENEQTVSTTPCDTLMYCAPEIYPEFVTYGNIDSTSHGKRDWRMPKQQYSHTMDVWSLGSVLFYCMTGATPYPRDVGISSTELFDRIMKVPFDIQPLKRHKVSAQGVDFISRMLQLRPEQRATVSDLQAHVWLLKLEDFQSHNESSDYKLGDQLPQSMDSGPDNEPDTMMEITDRPQPFEELNSPVIGNSELGSEIPWPTYDLNKGKLKILDNPIEDEAYTILDFQSTPSLEQIEQFISRFTTTINFEVSLSCQVQWQLLHVYKSELEFGANIGNFVTLTGTPSCAELNTINRFTANTWDTSSISKLIEKFVEAPSDIHDMSPSEHSEVIVSMDNYEDTATSRSSSTAHFQCRGSLYDVAIILQQLAWFAAVFTLPTRETLTLSIPTLSIIGEGRVSLSTKRISVASRDRRDQFDPFNRLDAAHCWHGLLRGAVLAYGFPISPRLNGSGLELPFDLMLALADIRSLVDTGENTILVGGSGLMLLPTKRLPGGMQWHCVPMNDENDDAPQSYDSIVAITEEDMEQFQNQRMFLGYYQHAQVLLGTRELVQSSSLQARESGFLPPPRRIELADEGTITGGISVKSILSMGISRKYVMTKTLRISLEGRGFHELVDEAEQQPAIVYDANTKCAWLVSELSVVLHIALSYLSNPKVQERRRTGYRQLQGEWPSLPYAAPRTDGGKESHRICKRPENCSLELWADGVRNKTFADVIEDTLKDFQSVRNSVAAQAKVTRRWAISRPGLRGWEYTEFLSRKTSFSEREVPRDGHYARWWELAKEKEKEMLVILVNGFGSLIRPTPFSKTMPGLVRIPPGSRLLVASQPCLSKMISLDRAAGPALGALNWGSVKEIHRSCNDHCDKASCFAIQILQLQSSLVKGDTRRPKDQVLYADAVIFGECEHYHKALFDAMLSNPSCLVKFTR